MNLYYLILIVFMLLLSCNDDIGNTNSSVPDCSLNDVYQCSSGNFTQINYCINCELCNTDDRLATFSKISILVETLPFRAGEVYDTIPLEGLEIYEGSICVPFIEGQDSLVIGLMFEEEEISSTESHLAVYEKLDIIETGVTNFHKKIKVDDFWNKPSCKMYTTIQRTPDFTEDIFASCCIVGSPGLCYQFSTGPTQSEFEKQVEESIQEWTEWYEEFSENTPCGEIYIQFD